MRPTSLFARVATACLASSLLAGCARADVPTTEAPAATHVGGELAWADWSKASFDRAKQDNRIILVNVVATWCHWCHVMEETTYVDPDVLSLLRDHFVTIRVDSDARPDVAERYRQWGWPATGFLSPDARPVLELRGYQNPKAFAAMLRGLVAGRDRRALAHRSPPMARMPMFLTAIECDV